MNYQQVSDLIKAVAGSLLVLPSEQYLEGELSDESFFSNRARYPLINLVSIIVRDGVASEQVSYQVRVRFLFLDTLDSLPEQRRVLFGIADKLARRFKTSLSYAHETLIYNIPYFELVDYSRTKLIKVNAAITSGWEASFTINSILDCNDDELTPEEKSFLDIESFNQPGRLLL